MTSCFTSASISLIRSTSNSTSFAFQTASTADCGTTPSSASFSVACASIRYQILYLFWSDQMAAISGRV